MVIEKQYQKYLLLQFIKYQMVEVEPIIIFIQSEALLSNN